MKPIALFVLLSLAFGRCAAADAPMSLNWQNRYEAATSEARRTGRALLLNFTGSDWCVWCDRLRDEVFQTPVFAQFAAASLILVEVDFPRRKPSSPELKKQNEGLAARFAVDGYPTVILLAPDGRELTRLGYMEGGPKTFVRELKRHLAVRSTAP